MVVSDARRNNTVGTIGALSRSRTTRRLEPSSDDFVAEGVGFSAACHAKTERRANEPVLLAPSSSPDRHPGYGPAMEDGDIDALTMTMVTGGVYVQYCTAYHVYMVRRYMSLHLAFICSAPSASSCLCDPTPYYPCRPQGHLTLGNALT